MKALVSLRSNENCQLLLRPHLLPTASGYHCQGEQGSRLFALTEADDREVNGGKLDAHWLVNEMDDCAWDFDGEYFHRDGLGALLLETVTLQRLSCQKGKSKEKKKKT